MKTIIITGASVAIITVLSLIIWNNRAVETTMPGGTGAVNPFPVSQVQNPTTPTTTTEVPFFVVRTDGTKLAIPDFRQRADVSPDPNNPGFYYFSGRQTAEQQQVPYSLYYSDFDTSFTITLLATPLAYHLQLAEQELLTKTGLNQDTLCTLNVGVFIPNDVDPLWGGQAIGLSFCPGAIPL